MFKCTQNIFQPKVVSVIVSEFILGRVYLYQNEVSNRHEVHYRCSKSVGVKVVT